MPSPLPFAVHLSDGVLSTPWWVAGWVPAALLVALGCRRIGEAEIPRIGVLTAAFFVGSQLHLPLGGASVHLLLNGLVAVVLGTRAAVAIAVGLLLQALLFAHGGLTTLGVNITVYTVPALLAGWACGPLRRSGVIRRRGVRFALVFLAAGVTLATALAAVQWVQWKLAGGEGFPTEWWVAEPGVIAGLLAAAVALAWAERWLEADPEFAVGLLLGAGTAYGTVVLNALVLALGAVERFRGLAPVALLANLPVVVVESVAVGFVVAFLARARPEWLAGGQPPAGSGNTSSNGTSH